MIFVTVGTAGQGMEFPRLVHEMDRVAGRLGQDVLIQLGTFEYRPQHARAVRFLSFAEALRMFREADLVVAHCGAGTVLNALSFGKPTVVVPARAWGVLGLTAVVLGVHLPSAAARVVMTPMATRTRLGLDRVLVAGSVLLVTAVAMAWEFWS